jgi:hypothetical protein
MPLRTFIMNSSHYCPSIGSNVYRLPLVSNPDLTGCKIGIQSLSLYNSTFNITAAYGNNNLNISFPNNGTPIVIDCLFNDGYYSSSDMNFFIQHQCILNKLYATNAAGQNVYFCEILQNPVRYALQLNTYPIPLAATALANGWVLPTGSKLAWATTAPLSVSPIVTFTQPFGNLLGLSATGIYGGLTTADNYISTSTPNINIVDSYVLRCNLLNNSYASPNDLFFSIPLTSSIGSLISMPPSDLVMCDIASNQYSFIQITFCDQNFNNLQMQDKEINIVLAMQDNRGVQNIQR